jgi:hypothetical protein
MDIWCDTAARTPAGAAHVLSTTCFLKDLDDDTAERLSRMFEPC